MSDITCCAQLRIVFGKPLTKQVFHLMRQTNQDIASPFGTDRASRGKYVFHFVIGDSRNDGRDHHTDWNAPLGKFIDHPQPCLRRSRARLERALDVAGKRGNAEAHRDQPILSKLGEQVDVAQDESALGNDRHGMAVAA